MKPLQLQREGEGQSRLEEDLFHPSRTDTTRLYPRVQHLARKWTSSLGLCNSVSEEEGRFSSRGRCQEYLCHNRYLANKCVKRLFLQFLHRDRLLVDNVYMWIMDLISQQQCTLVSVFLNLTHPMMFK